MLYKKKPVVVEAIKWDGLNLDEIIAFVGENLIYEIHDAGYQAGATPLGVGLMIRTLEGDMNVSFGDYIIKGVKGEFYPCKPDIFEQTYEPLLSPSLVERNKDFMISLCRAFDKKYNTFKLWFDERTQKSEEVE